MSYLICTNCGGYYQLQPGESPKDFSECQCGGKLKYTDEINVIKKYKGKLPSITSLATHTPDDNVSKDKKFFNMPKTLIISAVAVAAILFKLGVFNFLLIFMGHSNSYTYVILLILITAASFLVIRV